MSRPSLVPVAPTSWAFASSAGSSVVLYDNQTKILSPSTTEWVNINGVFTADYDNYLIRYACSFGGTGTGSPFLYLRMSSNGTPVTNTIYTQTAYETFGSSAPASFRNTVSYITVASVSAYNTSFIEFMVCSPFKAENTLVHGIAGGPWKGQVSCGLYAGTLNNTTSYDGFRLTYSEPTWYQYGRLQVFGFNK